MNNNADKNLKTLVEDLYSMHEKKVSLEHEYKYVASKDDLKTIRDKLSNSEFVKSVKRWVQINYYYDTVDHYYSKYKTTIRIRQKECGLELQVKIKDFFGEHHNKEIKERIDSIPNQMVYEEKYIKLQGHLVTDRTRFSCNGDITIDLDINYYCGKVDYEIEIELPNDEIKTDYILSLVNNLEQAKSGKSTRFYNRLLSLGDKVIGV